ncbi:hypothetical protein BDK51DRAFT_39784 [Blyttiomyces helicus]|uniref:Uncharacterized protein n=1 Tax=Blyttiomyces helicus TaxID=388810 RepID=A0A4P9WPS3_9FUNG|nr:hypothetical protein BDK51DRAFT_39784 [Blyttiomyces helicus]|eukprot:RKO94335.1 hypothetical protein BDK51DRAFT_39784 [Blyttiomyces helicus]
MSSRSSKKGRLPQQGGHSLATRCRFRTPPAPLLNLLTDDARGTHSQLKHKRDNKHIASASGEDWDFHQGVFEKVTVVLSKASNKSTQDFLCMMKQDLNLGIRLAVNVTHLVFMHVSVPRQNRTLLFCPDGQAAIPGGEFSEQLFSNVQAKGCGRSAADSQDDPHREDDGYNLTDIDVQNYLETGPSRAPSRVHRLSVGQKNDFPFSVFGFFGGTTPFQEGNTQVRVYLTAVVYRPFSPADPGSNENAWQTSQRLRLPQGSQDFPHHCKDDPDLDLQNYMMFHNLAKRGLPITVELVQNIYAAPFFQKLYSLIGGRNYAPRMGALACPSCPEEGRVHQDEKMEQLYNDHPEMARKLADEEEKSWLADLRFPPLQAWMMKNGY